MHRKIRRNYDPHRRVMLAGKNIDEEQINFFDVESEKS